MGSTQRHLPWISLLVVAILLLGLPGTARAQSDDACMGCHAQASMFAGHADADTLVVDHSAYRDSVHGQLGLPCVACHPGAAGDALFSHADSMPPEAERHSLCATCHQQATEQFSTSLHHYALVRGNPQAPSCTSCHSAHQTRRSADLAAPTSRANVVEQCASCHRESGVLLDHLVKQAASYDTWAASVHGQLAAEGELETALCTDCHGIHALRDPADPSSPLNRRNVATTCGRCHGETQSRYEQSIHGYALAAGIADSPTCVECHGEHLILPVHGTSRLAIETCATCHDDPVILAKYSLRDDVVGSYVDSYHGWAVQVGGGAAATCADCHTAHQVLPAADPTSSIHPDNVVDTCASCHPGADVRFAASYDHSSASTTANPVNRIIRRVYLVLIATLLGAMVLHNLVILGYHLGRSRREHERGPWVLRMARSERVQHLLLILSFTGLVLTGFALRFHDSWWVEALMSIGLDEPLRADLHRLFAALLLAVGAWHLVWLAASPRGRQSAAAIKPRLSDLREARQNLAFHLGLRPHRARFGRFDYTQKAEYWALLWGTVVMALTGFVLWFPADAVKLLPSWSVSAAQTIHYYEAWLALLSILVWHLFFVVIHPEAYPMTWTWLTGRMKEADAREHHPRWVEDPPSSPVEDEE